MGQVSWRAEDELVDRVRHAADRAGASMNEWISRVLDAATDPTLAGDDVERLRERLANAGLLEPTTSSSGARPDRKALRAARSAAGEGISLAKVVRDGRR